MPQAGFWLRLNSGLAPKPEAKDASGQNRDNGKENGNYRDYRGFYRANGKENGNYHVKIGYI